MWHMFRIWAQVTRLLQHELYATRCMKNIVANYSARMEKCLAVSSQLLPAADGVDEGILIPGLGVVTPGTPLASALAQKLLHAADECGYRIADAERGSEQLMHIVDSAPPPPPPPPQTGDFDTMSVLSWEEQDDFAACYGSITLSQAYLNKGVPDMIYHDAQHLTDSYGLTAMWVGLQRGMLSALLSAIIACIVDTDRPSRTAVDALAQISGIDRRGGSRGDPAFHSAADALAGRLGIDAEMTPTTFPPFETTLRRASDYLRMPITVHRKNLAGFASTVFGETPVDSLVSSLTLAAISVNNSSVVCWLPLLENVSIHRNSGVVSNNDDGLSVIW